MKAKHINEVLRSDDEYANAQIDKWQGKDELVAEPEQPEETTDEETHRLANWVSTLEEFIWENGAGDVQEEWDSYVTNLMNDYGEHLAWYELTKDDLEVVYLKAKMLENKIKRGSYGS